MPLWHLLGKAASFGCASPFQINAQIFRFPNLSSGSFKNDSWHMRNSDDTWHGWVEAPLAYVGCCVGDYPRIIGWILTSQVSSYLLSVVGLVPTLHVCWHAMPILVASPFLDCFLVKGHSLLLEGLHDTCCCYSDSLQLVVTFFSRIDGADVQ